MKGSPHGPDQLPNIDLGGMCAFYETSKVARAVLGLNHIIFMIQILVRPLWAMWASVCTTQISLQVEASSSLSSKHPGQDMNVLTLNKTRNWKSIMLSQNK